MSWLSRNLLRDVAATGLGQVYRVDLTDPRLLAHGAFAGDGDVQVVAGQAMVVGVAWQARSDELLVQWLGTPAPVTFPLVWSALGTVRVPSVQPPARRRGDVPADVRLGGAAPSVVAGHDPVRARGEQALAFLPAVVRSGVAQLCPQPRVVAGWGGVATVEDGSPWSQRVQVVTVGDERAVVVDAERQVAQEATQGRPDLLSGAAWKVTQMVYELGAPLMQLANGAAVRALLTS